MTDTRAFGERLRTLREAAGLSQTALAGDRFSPSYLSHLESGRREPTPSTHGAQRNFTPHGAKSRPTTLMAVSE